MNQRKFKDKRGSPPQLRRGGRDTLKNNREASFVGADGVVLVKTQRDEQYQHFRPMVVSHLNLVQHHPGCAKRLLRGFRLIARLRVFVISRPSKTPPYIVA